MGAELEIHRGKLCTMDGCGGNPEIGVVICPAERHRKRIFTHPVCHLLCAIKKR